MARSRNRTDNTTDKENTDMSDFVFETLSEDEWKESGAGLSAEKGEYARILQSFVDAGAKHARIPTDSGRFAGKKASTITTALKNARDAKNAPDGLDVVVVSSKNGSVYLRNKSVA